MLLLVLYPLVAIVADMLCLHNYFSREVCFRSSEKLLIAAFGQHCICQLLHESFESVPDSRSFQGIANLTFKSVNVLLMGVIAQKAVSFFPARI